ncbi:MAG TPA: hypothetical protein VLF09_07230, partial [Cellvibrio sp.]|nr:hypothetical protein [Cellvibrio sp.]
MSKLFGGNRDLSGYHFLFLRPWVLSALLVATCGAAVNAQALSDYAETPQVKAQLIASVQSVAPGAE